MNYNIKVSFLLLCILIFASCKTEIKNLSYNQNNYDSCSIDLDYIRNGKKVKPIREIITVKVPSTDYLSRKSTRKNVILPDKEIGSNVPIVLKVCGEYKKGKYVCDSIIRYSSNKSLKIEPLISFRDRNNPSIYIRTDLYRNKYNSSTEEFAQSIFNATGTIDIQFNGKTSSESLPIKSGYNYSDIFTLKRFQTNTLQFTTLKNDIKKAFSKKGELELTYDIKFDWKGESFRKSSSQHLEAPIIEINENYYYTGELQEYDSRFYKYYNYGSRLGVITFKERSSDSKLQVEVYTDSDFTQLASSSLKSNVLFDSYHNQYLYIKVFNNGPVFGSGHQYMVGAHSVDHQKIMQNKSGERAFYEFLGWIFDTDANNVTRTVEIASIFLDDNTSLDTGVSNFLGNEFKRQISNSLGGNFATDVGVEVTAEIGERVYHMFNNIEFKN